MQLGKNNNILNNYVYSNTIGGITDESLGGNNIISNESWGEQNLGIWVKGAPNDVVSHNVAAINFVSGEFFHF